MEELNKYGRVVKLQPKDVFCVNVEAFLKDSSLWSHKLQVIGTDEYRRKHWWQFWKPWKMKFIKIMYLGDNENEQS